MRSIPFSRGACPARRVACDALCNLEPPLSPPDTTRRPRPGYTLLEVLLVFALIGLIAGIVWPVFAGGTEELTLEMAAADVLVACRYARNEAIVSGWRHCLRFRQGVAGDRPVLELVAFGPWAGESDAVAAQDPYGRGIAFPEGTEVELLPGSDDGLETGELPVMCFYPDGSSDGGEVRLVGPRHAYIVRIARFTGRSEMQRRWTAELEDDGRTAR